MTRLNKKKQVSDKQLLALAKNRAAEHLRKGEKVPREISSLIGSLTKGKARKKSKKEKPQQLSHEQIQEIGNRLWDAFNKRHPGNPAKTFKEAMMRDLEEQRQRREEQGYTEDQDQFKEVSQRFWSKMFGKDPKGGSK